MFPLAYFNIRLRSYLECGVNEENGIILFTLTYPSPPIHLLNDSKPQENFSALCGVAAPMKPTPVSRGLQQLIKCFWRLIRIQFY